VRIVKTDLLDRRAWETALDASDPLHQLVEANEAENNGLDDLVADLFQTFHQRVPVMAPPHSLTLAEHVLREVTETQEFKQLKASTRGDLVNATFATHQLGTKLVEKMSALLKEELKEEHEELEEDDLDDADDGDIDDGPDGFPAPVGRKGRKRRGRESRPVDPDKIGELRRDLREAAKDVQKQVDAIQEAEDMLGGKSGHSLEAKLALSQKVGRSTKLKQMMELAGRLRRVALAKKASVIREVPQETVGIKVGDDITQAVPSELALLAHPATAPLFYKKLVEKQIMLWDKQGEEKLGGGAIVLLLDGSGSMAGARELWSKSVMMAYLAVAEKDKRDLHVMQFSSHGKTASWEFPFRSNPAAVDRGKILEAVEVFLDGATDLEGPLRWAVEQIKVPASNPMSAADVVVITDAECTFSAEFISEFGQAQARLGFRTQGVLIGAPAYLPHFQQVCGEAIAIDSLKDDDKVTDLLFKR
jgi:uncharacterized protein with von Willebrand factor type A (vWA) domain